MKFKIQTCVIAGLAMGALMSTASAQTLISQAPNGVNGFFSDETLPQSMADDFIIGAGGANLGILTWYGAYFPSNTIVPDQFNIRIHADTGGLPDGGAAFLNLSNVAADTRAISGGPLFGVDEYVYTINLGGLHLDAGTYWLEIFNNTSQNTDNWFWETGDLDAVNGRFGDAFALETPGVGWLSNPSDNAFSIQAAVPAPGTFALLGLAGIASVRRRRN